jgi:hypothetical protein
MAEMKAQDANSWLQFITDFDAVYQSFDDNYNALLAIGPEVNQYPDLIPNYDRLVNDGAIHRTTLENLKATRDYAASWINWLQSGAQGVFSAFGLSGYHYRESGLGVLPLVLGVGAAIAALAGITYYMKEIYIAAQRYNTFLAERARGRSPEQSVAAANQLFPEGSLFGSIIGGDTLTTILLIAAAIFVAPPLIRALTNGRN